ncbi:MAG TPA: ABC transporter substrate-binding protein [Thermomicrobiales bacterium]|nr:ABC transporter substrate-binding protein [Thermomicrobiales bacterium]
MSQRPISPSTADPSIATSSESHPAQSLGDVAISRRNLVRTTAMVAGLAAAGGAATNVLAAPANTPEPTRAASQTDVQTKVEVAIPLIPYGQPVTIDPHRTVNWGPFWTLFPHVWSGLLRFDENGKVEPDLAASLDANENQTVWTAKLRDDIKFASGRAITAADFIASWKRALSPAALTPMSGFMAPIKGFAAFTAGKSTELGIVAKDAKTIEITLAASLSSFPYYLATFVYAVLDGDVLGKATGADAKDPLLSGAGAGAWQFTEFMDDDHLTMIPNPNYWDDPSPSISKVTWTILSGDDAETIALEQYKSNVFASADVPLSQYDAVNGDATLKPDVHSLASQGSTLAIGLDFNQAPFNDVRIRKAVAASIDRDAWAKNVWKESYAPASAFTSPASAANTAYTSPKGIAYDVDQAKKWLSDAKFDPAKNATDIVYYQPATDSTDDQKRHAQLLKMIEDAIGLTIRQDTTLTADQIAAQAQDNGGRQFDIVWWWPDGDAGSLLAKIGTSTSPYMAGWFNWSKGNEKHDNEDPGKDSQSFDKYIADAAKNGSESGRNKNYKSAEQLLLDNAVYIPLGYWVQRFVQKPWLQGTKQGPWSGRIPVRFDKDVIVKGKPS